MATDTNPQTPADIFADPSRPRPHESISALADAGLLTDRQAEVYFRRVILQEPREAVADDMGIQPSTLDTHRMKAMENVDAARRTVAALDAIESTYQELKQ